MVAAADDSGPVWDEAKPAAAIRDNHDVGIEGGAIACGPLANGGKCLLLDRREKPMNTPIVISTPFRGSSFGTRLTTSGTARRRRRVGMRTAVCECLLLGK